MKVAPNNYEFDINLHEKTIYSQNGEDGILEFIFSRVKTTNKFFVEFGVEDGFECNTVYILEKKGWKGLMMDYVSDDNIKQEKNVLEQLWSNRKLSLSKNIEKDLAFFRRKIRQVMHFKKNVAFF